jgi:hypothetical protein
MTDKFLIHEYDVCRYYTGKSLEITIYEGIPSMWSMAPMPDNPQNLYAILSDDGESWRLTDIAPPTPAEGVPTQDAVTTETGQAPTVI